LIRLEQQYKAFHFVKVDINQSGGILSFYPVRNVPTVLFFRNQQVLPKYTVRGINATQIESNLIKLITLANQELPTRSTIQVITINDPSQNQFSFDYVPLCDTPHIQSYVERVSKEMEDLSAIPEDLDVPEVSEVPEIPELPEVSEVPEVPEISTSEVPEIPMSEIPTSEVPDVSTSEVPEVPTSEVPDVSTSEVPEVPTSEVPDVSTSEVPEVPGVPEVPEVPEIEVKEVPNVEDEVTF
jgi:hypothetical protein